MKTSVNDIRHTYKANGEWVDEPDKCSWVDPSTNLKCYIIRNNLSVLCGYVGIKKSHPLFGSDYDYPNFDVHGGLTYAGHAFFTDSLNYDEWWFGFDCGHYNDYTPRMYDDSLMINIASGFHDERPIYRNLKYVIREVEKLAKQLHGPS